MQELPTYHGGSKLHEADRNVSGDLVELEGESYFMVKNYDAMPPFLMSIVSNSDHWMFISSSGGLTAGRKNADNALFPYYTDDKIHESYGSSGSLSILRIKRKNRVILWEPFSRNDREIYNCSANLYKATTGNKVIFEETNHDLELTVRIRWMNSETFGWIRETELQNHAAENQEVRMLDGIRNILPFGIKKPVQEQYSTLMDAYKRSELQEDIKLGIFSMSSIPVDRAEPSEALKATTAWFTGHTPDGILMSCKQVDDFRKSGQVQTERDIKGLRGAFLAVNTVSLSKDIPYRQMIMLDVAQDSKMVHNLVRRLEMNEHLIEEIYKSVSEGSSQLENIVARADGIQHCGDPRISVRHFANVLFNVMRGGIYADDYLIYRKDLEKHFRKFNRDTAREHADWFLEIDSKESYMKVVGQAEATEDPDVTRIMLEYLPITFSRRHGDPSRPWNRFSIDIKEEDGSRSLSYEGNWRDIFQNWEALSYSYPYFLEGIITKFLNASTADGYNPYRITDCGIDWEVFDPDDPWSFIGYWGDHQIIYLLKLLDLHERFFPGKLSRLLNRKIFVFADVPYRIKTYDEILVNPDDTIRFDEHLHKELIEKYLEIGADGKLLRDKNDHLLRTTLGEKLLVPLLTKLSNFIPGGGIWMNTQRPEWNDANNALVGNGVSMVTLYYIRKYLRFLSVLFENNTGQEQELLKETAEFLESISDVFKKHVHLLDQEFSDTDRKRMTDLSGRAGSVYREKVYARKIPQMVSVSAEHIRQFLNLSQKYVDHTIDLNRRIDGLYHAYNLMAICRDKITLERLPLMLEGQVAYLSSGHAGLAEVAKILKALKKSDLYRKDQRSYMLYPDYNLTGFTNKNNIDAELTGKYPAVEKLADAGADLIIVRDSAGMFHFNGQLRNAGVLREHIEKVRATGNVEIDPEMEKELFELYELLFHHKSFTGRSGSFFKYEGLGSIYWHMVSKLQLAVAENISDVEEWNDGADLKNILLNYYSEIREGIGIHKQPDEYGAIPTDPYSHTPSMLGAQQPGMTGQVKEDIITRWFELGIKIHNGKIILNPGHIQQTELDDKGELSFTFCGTPVTYCKADKDSIAVKMRNGSKKYFHAGMIDPEISAEIFKRSGNVLNITVTFKSS